jgi:ribosomal protein L34E
LIDCVRTNASATVVDFKAASQSAPACPRCGTAMKGPFGKPRPMGSSVIAAGVTN